MGKLKLNQPGSVRSTLEKCRAEQVRVLGYDWDINNKLDASRYISTVLDSLKERKERFCQALDEERALTPMAGVGGMKPWA